MVRWRILQTLLWKEALRFRYNLGLIVVIGSLLALSALVSISSQFGTFFGQAQELRKYYVAHDPAQPGAPALVAYLQRSVPAQGSRYHLDPDKVEFLTEAEARQRAIKPQRHPLDPTYPGDSVTAVLRLIPQDGTSVVRVDYHFPERTEGEVLPFQHWLDESIHQRLRGKLLVVHEFQRHQVTMDIEGVGKRLEGGSRLSKIVTALVIFAFYLLSFNIFITTTAEEREKKALLAVMLTPARPLEIILAKVLFYATLSVVVSMAVVAMYKPLLLANAVLWLTVFTGAAAYVAIGTVVLCLVRRQTTINNVSMMYLIFTAVIMILGQFLWGFNFLRGLMVENYLFRHLEQLIDGARYTHPLFEQAMITLLTVVWIGIAVLVFRRRGVRIGHVSR